MNTANQNTESKPRLKLVGTNGNAFALLGLAHQAAKMAKWTNERWRAVRDEATAGDYDHLFATLCEHFEVT